MSAAKEAEAWSAMFNELKKNHDEAFRIIETAIQLEESGKKSEALAVYESGLLVLDKALNTHIGSPSNPDATWDKACSMIMKMKKTKKEILCRLADSQTSAEPNLSPPSELPPPSFSQLSSQPPSYEEATSMDSSSTNSDASSILTYRELGAALQNLKVETGAQSATILYTHPCVQLYFISPDGTVTAPSEPGELKIVELEGEGEGERPRAYLQVGSWIYPLVPGVSPCFRADFGAFILPDLHSGVQGAAVGIILPKDEDESIVELLNDILFGISKDVVPYAAPTAPPRAGRVRRDLGLSISQGIVSGARFVSQGMMRGAERAGMFMNSSTPKLINHITPESSPAQVNPKVQTGLRVAKNVTGTAVAVTGFVASRVGSATMALGRYLAPHVQRQGARLLSSTCNYSQEEASKKVGSVLQVAAGAVEGFATVYDGLEHSAKILGTSLTTNTVKIVQHKYGQPAGEVAGDTMYTMGNVFVAGNNIRHLTPKGLAKNTAKQTGKAVVEEYRTALRDKNGVDGGPSTSKQ